MNIHAMLTHIVLSCKLFGADTTWKSLAVIRQVALHMPSQAAAVVERSLTQPAAWSLPFKFKRHTTFIQVVMRWS